jgi:O-antigen/teichoic acid export membrane protein
MSYVKTFAKNAVSNWANMAVSLVISFILSPFILHKIGNTYFGVWALVSQVTGYLWLLDFGVRDSVIKYVAEFHEKKDTRMLNHVINASLKLYFNICLACIALSIGSAAIFPVIFTRAQEAIPIVRILVIITGLDIAQTFIFNVFVGILMGMQRYDVFSRISIILSITRGFLIILFLNEGYGVIAICLVQFLSNLCMNAVVYVSSRRLLSYSLNFRKYGRERAIYRMLANYSFFVFLNCIALQIFSFSSNFIIAIFLPVSSVTFFAIAANLVEYMRKVIWAGTQAISPLTSQLDAKDDPSRISALLSNGSRFSLLFGLPVGAVYLLMGKQFIGLWMGREYAAISGNVLAVLTIMTLFSLPSYTISGILLGLNMHKLTAYCRMIEALANIVLSVFLTKYMGVVGTAIGIAIPNLIIVGLVLPMLAIKVLKIRLSDYLRSSYYGPIICVLPFALACFLTGILFTPKTLLTFFLMALLLSPIYIVSAWFFAISAEERRICKDAVVTYATGTLGR